MSDDLPSGPERIPVTAEWLAEQRRKQAAYEASRRRHHERLYGPRRGERDEPDEAESSSPGEPAVSGRRRSRGKVNDPRQFQLDL